MSWMEQRVIRGDVELWCSDTGSDRPAVMLLHGLAGHAGEWSRTVDHLRSTHRVVAFDQRGHGRSTRHPVEVSRDAYVHDVAAVATALGISRMTLVGQSMGGHTAILAAARHPELVERLVLVETGVGGGGPAVTAAVAGLLSSWPVPFVDHSAARACYESGWCGHGVSSGTRCGPWSSAGGVNASPHSRRPRCPP
jgi:pimeloyl-ACP methyl ester carboxylesterase